MSRGPHLLPVLVALVLAACASTRGADCDTDSDCDSGQSCISPGCASSQKKCAITSSTDDDCHSKADAEDRCVKPNADCVAYCSPG